MEKRKKVGIKYCGGCNPTYERVEIAQRVQSLIESQFLFLWQDQKELDVLVSINGCHRACGIGGLNQTGIPYLSITRESELEKLIDWLSDVLNEEGDFK